MQQSCLSLSLSNRFGVKLPPKSDSVRHTLCIPAVNYPKHFIWGLVFQYFSDKLEFKHLVL